MPYNPGMLNGNRLRDALDMEMPTFIAYEQREKSVKELLNILAAATSSTGGMARRFVIINSRYILLRRDYGNSPSDGRSR